MIHFRTLVVAAVIACIPFAVNAQTNSTDAALVDQIIETLALAHKVAQPPADFVKQFERNPFRLEEETNQQWLNTFSKAYNKKQLMQNYRNVLRNKLNQLSADELKAWLNRSSTQKLAKARQEYYTLQGKRKRIIALYELEQDPPSEERQKLIATYAETITPKNAIVESSVAIFQPIIKTIGQVSSRLNFTETQINMIVSNFRKQGPMRIKQLKERILPVQFFGISSARIKQSLAFWQSKTGQALAKAIYQSMQQTYEQAGQRFTEAITVNN